MSSTDVVVLPSEGEGRRRAVAPRAPQVFDPIPVLDSNRFEHMQRIAAVMARSTLLPESLTHTGTKDRKSLLPFEEVLANAFLVVNQAVRWGLDPFAVAQCVSVVHGRLCYEGKLVAAVLEAKASIRLHHAFTGAGDQLRIFISDVPFEERLTLEPGMRPFDRRMLDGSVAEWKTTGANSPWSPANFRRQLLYRGTRDWARAYEPALMLGVYTDDEMNSLQARDVTPPKSRLGELLGRDKAETSAGFSAGFVANELGRREHGDGREKGALELVNEETGEIVSVETGEVSAEEVSAQADAAPAGVAEREEPGTTTAEKQTAIGGASEAVETAEVIPGVKDRNPRGNNAEAAAAPADTGESLPLNKQEAQHHRRVKQQPNALADFSVALGGADTPADVDALLGRYSAPIAKLGAEAVQAARSAAAARKREIGEGASGGKTPAGERRG